jgi:formylglycine-generating enzyme required for sulfatase activity
MPPILRYTPRTAQGFVEPLLKVGDLLPLHMVLIPGGTFLMGQTEAEKAELIRQAGEKDYNTYYARELPQHSVTVPPFLMGRYPITQAQYGAVMAANPAADYDQDRFVYPNKPVVGVSSNQAVAFCQRLTQRTGRPYRCLGMVFRPLSRQLRRSSQGWQCLG